MEELYKLKETLCNELEEYSKKGKMSAGDLEIVDKLSHSIKIEKYDESEYSGAMGYSNRMIYGRGGYSNERGGYSNNDYSMARGDGRGRGSNARRDSMGRYASEGHDMVMELREMMEEAPDERTRMEFEKFIRKMEQM